MREVTARFGQVDLAYSACADVRLCIESLPPRTLADRSDVTTDSAFSESFVGVA